MRAPWSILMLVIAAALAVSACGTTTVTSKPDASTGADTAATEDTSAAQEDTAAEKTPKPKAKPKAAGVGDSITLDGTDGQVKIKLDQVIDPLPVGEFDSASDGMRLVGVRITITNTGGTAYDDSPSNGMAIITTRDEQADPTITMGGKCKMQAGIKIAPGAKRKVCVPFEVPAKQKLKTLQFTPDSGFADNTGEWKLR